MAASTDTFQPPSFISHKLLDPAFHGLSAAAHAALLSPFVFEDLDIFDSPDSLLLFDQDALLADAGHLEEQDTAHELSSSPSTWSINELYSREEVQQTTSTPAPSPTACLQYSPSNLLAEGDTLQHKEAPQVSKLPSVPSAQCDRVIKKHPFVRHSLAHTASKRADHDAMDRDGGDGKATHSGKASTAKNIVSERKRRRKLNERLYSLRALVPNISKMDKASIVNDAIDYVQKLQNLVKDMEGDIHTLQTRGSDMQKGAFRHVKSGMVSAKCARQEVDYKILKVEVAKMEETTYHLRILCQKGRGVFVKLAKALEALQLEIVNANLTSVSDHILNTIVLKAKDGGSMEPKELREMILDLVPRFGLGLAKEG